ncbi:M23/M56 family metallopeptidase [Rapidithrix thailandica]|uniref:M23/M56 family metallopeptidase n=1 Tax=Rapidithrix thailandica TaxID=413964 RepID=A0AAW9S5E1_9BACT
MTDFFVYLCKVSMCLTLLYGIYFLFLRKETFLIANRLYLLGTVLLSWTIPLLNLTKPVGWSGIQEEWMDLGELPAGPFSEEQLQIDEVSAFDWGSALMLIYLLGMVVMWLRFVMQGRLLYRVVHSGEIQKKEGVRLVVSQKIAQPLSFFRWVVLPEKYVNPIQGSYVFAHEKAHVNQWHSFDLLVVEVVQVFLWFNPFIYFLKKSLKQTHEYLADREVLHRGFCKITYMQALYEEVLHRNISSLAHSFYSSTKNRITMMTKSKSATWSLVKYTLMTPVLGFLLMAFSYQNTANSVALPFMETEVLFEGRNIPSILPIKEGECNKMTSGFGMRKHPITKKQKMHKGMDFSAEVGVKVMATADGVVAKVDTTHKGYGQHIIVKHGEQYSTVYAQLSSIEVKEGQQVRRGEVIGLVGSSGMSTGPHLHYEVLKNGIHVNPADYLGK